MKVLALKRSIAQKPLELDALYAPENMPHLLAESDFVLVTLPLTSETEGSIGKQEFSLMKESAFFINVSRGKIVCEDELIAALQSGTIAGAALDVFEKEPLPEDSPLWDMEQVIVTPHSCGGFVGFTTATTDLFLENVRRSINKEPLINVINTSQGY